MWLRKGNVFSRHHAQVPVVDNYSTFFRIYYSTRKESKSIPMYFDLDKKTFQVINESNHPILELGSNGNFDCAGVMPTEIISLGTSKHLYYVGWTNRKDVPYHNSLGLAISLDNGETWKKASEGPVFNSCFLESGFVGTISIIQEQDHFRGYYLSCRQWEKINGRMEPFYDIKLATSFDNGISWIPENITCVKLRQNEGGISKASVLKTDKGYEMWFSFRGKSDYRFKGAESYRIGYASSSDGIIWYRKEEIELDLSLDGWDCEMVAYPHIVIDENKILMFYNGNGFGKTGIGYAEKILK